MRESFLNEQRLPLVIEPANGKNTKSDLLDWMQQNRGAMMHKFYETGALLFRGFEIDKPQDFEGVVLQTAPQVEEGYYGTSPRNVVPGTKYVYTASELPGYYPIMQHCEMSYVKHPPVILFFYCHVEPEYGGETPLCNFRKVYRDIDPSVREDFEKKGIITVRNYSGLGKSSPLNLFELKKWNEIFLTTDKAEVERQCREQEIEYEWLNNGGLRLVHRTPVAIDHPKTKEKTWFNHLQVFHPAAAAFEYDYIHAHQHRAKTFFWSLFLKTLVKIKSATT
ncbi:MAG TPA: TauD/TfdA family dioxygenase, partial [Chitinophagales bacterium]|nr:TauD/TfdA family dioxygenase [Chitinophagales bacterium]